MTGRFERLGATAVFRAGGLERWQRGTVGIVGAGTLGSVLAPEVVRSGAAVWVCDPDRGEEANLGTQRVEVGVPKAESVAAVCNAIAPGRARFFVGDVRAAVLGDLAACDVLIDCSDDPALAAPLTEVSNGLDIPLLRIAVDPTGDRALGRVLTSNGGDGGACQRCAHAPAPVAGRTPCGVAPAARPPTRAGAGLALAVAGIGLLQAQRLLTGRQLAAVRDREVFVDLDQPQLRSFALERSAGCLSGHVRWRVEDSREGVDRLTAASLRARARAALGTADVQLQPHRVHLDLHRTLELGLGDVPLAALGLRPGDGFLARAAGRTPIAFLTPRSSS